MPVVKGKQSRGEKVHNRGRRHRSVKSAESKETSVAAAKEGSALSFRDPASNASLTDSTSWKGDAEDTEAGAVEAELTTATVAPGEHRTLPSELDKQPPTETDLQPIGPMPLRSSLPTIGDRAPASSSGTDASAIGGNLQNDGDERAELPLPVHLRQREASFLDETAATPPAGGFHKGNATTGSEEMAHSTRNAAPYDARTTVNADGKNASEESLGSAGTGTPGAESDRPRDASRGQVSTARVARGQRAAVKAVGDRDRNPPTDASKPVSRKDSVAAVAAASATSPASLEGADKAKTTAQRSVNSMKSSVSRRSSLSRPGETKAPNLAKSLYEKMADIRKSPRIAKLTSTMNEVRVVLLLATIIGAIVAIVFIVTIIITDYKEDSGVKTCNTVDCRVHASLLKASINWSVDPCDDFSAYVCSSWVPKKAAFRLYSVMDTMRNTWYNQFGDTLRRGSTKIPAGKKALAMYEMCMKASLSDDGSSVHVPLILSLFRHLPAGWHNVSNEAVSAVSLAVLLAYKYQSPFWLTINVIDRSSSPSRRVVVKPSAYVPMFLGQHNVAASSYRQYMTAFYTAYSHYSGEFPINLAVDRANLVRDMEADVLGQLNYVYSQMAKPAVFPFGEINAMVANASAGRRSLFQSIREALSLKPQLTTRDMVLASHVTLFDVLVGLVAKYGDAELKYLLVWEFVQLYLPLGDLSLLVTVYGSKWKADAHRNIYCTFHVDASFKVLVLSLAVVSGFAAELRDRIDARFDILISTAMDKLKRASWLDEESKIRVVNKLALVKKQMWLPQSLMMDDALANIYADISGNETSVAEFWMKAHMTMEEVNGLADYMEALRLPANNLSPYINYDYILNSVEVGISIAAAPAFYMHGTAAMFYGGLGLLMAMQLVRFIDKKGLKWAAAEVMVDSILSTSSRQAYEDRFHCLSEYRSTHIFPEIPALEIVHSALLEANGLDGEEHLALSPELPEGKVFFLTICYLTCAAPGFTHLASADCNKLVQNSEYFAKVFNCPKGSRMNPHRKCSFF
ncbi:hypothetical protein MTO96_011220 [Rhipicephalus appendiculatus]